MESLEGKHFSITDPVNVNTVVYRLDETEKEFAKNSPKFTIYQSMLEKKLRKLKKKMTQAQKVIHLLFYLLEKKRLLLM